MTQIPNVTAGARSGIGEPMEGGTYDPGAAAMGASPDRGRRDTHAEAPEAPRSDPAQPEAPSSGGDAPPDGTVQEVLEWVGSDSDRARAALDAERAGRGRSTLIAALEPIAG